MKGMKNSKKVILYCFLLSLILNIIFSFLEFFGSIWHVLGWTGTFFMLYWYLSLVITYFKRVRKTTAPIKFLIKLPWIGFSILCLFLFLYFPYEFTKYNMSLINGFIATSGSLGFLFYFLFLYFQRCISKIRKIFEQLGEEFREIDSTLYLFFDSVFIKTKKFSAWVTPREKMFFKPRHLAVLGGISGDINLIAGSATAAYGIKRVESQYGKLGVYAFDVLLDLDNVKKEKIPSLEEIIDKSFILKKIENTQYAKRINQLIKQFPEISKHITKLCLYKTKYYTGKDKIYMRVCIEDDYVERNMFQVYKFISTLKNMTEEIL